MPPIAFSYTEAIIDPKVHEADEAVAAYLPAGVDGNQVQWADLYGEGLQGILYEDDGAWWYQKNKGDHRYYDYNPANKEESPKLIMTPFNKIGDKPASVGTNMRTQLTDLDSDGVPELLVQEPDMSGFYEQDTEGKWKHFKAFQSNPNMDWSDPNLRFIDLTGDGYADILMTEEHCLTWYESLAKEGYAEARQVAKALDERQGPAIVFEDREQVIYLADMSGDGLTDIVRGAQWCHSLLAPIWGMAVLGNKYVWIMLPI